MVLDHYRVLGLSSNATLSDVKDAYYRLAKIYHPDTNTGNQEAETKFLEIQVAYKALKTKLDAFEKAHESPVKEGEKAEVSKLSKMSNAASTMNQYDMYYRLLELQPGALVNDIQAAYFRLLKSTRSDETMDDAKKAQRISEIEYAYNMLSGKQQQDPDEW